MKDFFKSYFEYAGATVSEPPAIFHRWSAVSMVSALLGRQCYVPFGHSKIYPNQYIMIMGSPGTRKSSAINVSTKLLRLSGYSRFSSDRTSKERFLMDMRQTDALHLDEEDLLDLTLDEPSETYVAIGEFTDFIGQGNMEFVTMLTNLWDCPPSYTNPKIHGKSVEVHEPVVNILGGNTAQGFTLAFPPEALGNGFLSRLIFVHGDTSGRKVTFPPTPDELLEESLVIHLKEIKKYCKGAFTFTEEAKKALDTIYQTDMLGVEDQRFIHYGTRRFTHLLKVSSVLCASRISMEICLDDVLKANTLLFHTEKRMSKALGEFGKSKYSDISNSILDILNRSRKPLTSNDIYKKVSQDIGKMSELIEVIKNLQLAGKVQLVKVLSTTGYMALHEATKEWDSSLIMNDWLTAEELQ